MYDFPTRNDYESEEFGNTMVLVYCLAGCKEWTGRRNE